MNGLKLHVSDYFLTDKNAVTVADRRPQPAFPHHCHEFDKIVFVWRGNGLHTLNDVPYLITCGDVFYINARDRHGYESVNDLALDNVLYRRDLLTLNVNWQTLLPGRGTGPDERQDWCLSTPGMAILRQSVDALSKECMKSDALSLLLSETLFYFSVVFNQAYGLSPRQYRQRFQKVLSLG
ncbi:HTH-type transcriptional activator RhaR [Sodalis glossinidius str. 'morsitans']|uniref:HTH-type transcriptional activator RhaR n=1 Tax=Sodalis glossinidius (strain morsitans) TaxID=343509 RepID=Q2NRC4_SODGM|nr:putative L-rhamnose operon transcriptional activator [Sodalis glossinidius str. 'morsitans']CRL46305.1 HTH-type transcriptional activator RhaR [Sodalis glossinidius str. 'morsitans']